MADCSDQFYVHQRGNNRLFKSVRVASNLKTYFLLKHGFQFYETNLIQIASSVYEPLEFISCLRSLLRRQIIHMSLQVEYNGYPGYCRSWGSSVSTVPN
jgi:hypothetical protein